MEKTKIQGKGSYEKMVEWDGNAIVGFVKMTHEVKWLCLQRMEKQTKKKKKKIIE